MFGSVPCSGRPCVCPWEMPTEVIHWQEGFKNILSHRHMTGNSICAPAQSISLFVSRSLTLSLSSIQMGTERLWAHMDHFNGQSIERLKRRNWLGAFWDNGRIILLVDSKHYFFVATDLGQCRFCKVSFQSHRKLLFALLTWNSSLYSKLLLTLLEERH